MNPFDTSTVVPELPGIMPDNRVVAGMSVYSEPSAVLNLVRGAGFIRGMVSGLTREGVGVLRQVVTEPNLKLLVLVIGLHGSGRTWDDVLFDLLALQDSDAARVHFRLLARRAGEDRPANLLWVQSQEQGHGHIIVGNVGNLLAVERWDATDAVIATPLDPASAEALGKRVGNILAQSRALTVETAAAPRLSPPSGSVEGARMWQEHLDLLDNPQAESGAGAAVTVDPQTGEVTSVPEPLPPMASNFPKPDPVLLAVQSVLAKGSVVALDRLSLAPPLAAPVKADLFGERSETRSGAARRQQRFSVSLFDEDVTRRLEARKTVPSALAPNPISG